MIINMSKITVIEKFLKDIKTLDQLDVTYFSILLNVPRGEDGEWKKKDDGRLEKKPDPSTIKKYKGMKVETSFNKTHNATMIPLGEKYNLIGIDVDNKSDTLPKFNEIIEENGEFDTLTMKTMHGGYHYYFKLNQEQREELEELQFKSKNNALFSLYIDVKYTDQVF